MVKRIEGVYIEDYVAEKCCFSAVEHVPGGRLTLVSGLWDSWVWLFPYPKV